MKIATVLLTYLCVATAIEVKLCSEPNFQGSCATKTYDSHKCEHLPWRFRWIYSVNSVMIKPNFFGSCNARCELHTKENCGHSLMSAILLQSSLAIPFDCQRPLVSVNAGLTYKGMVCNSGGIFG